jgi:arylsulfatase A-like enzyme
MRITHLPFTPAWVALGLLLAIAHPSRLLAEAPGPARPNILFISVDDLNDWIGCLGGHPQTITPNIDRLAASGILFTNAHCAAASCNPSRTAIFTGRSPHRSGLYDNRQRMRDVLPDAELLPKALSRQGYYSAGAGKLLHYFIERPSWDAYFPGGDTEWPLPETLYPEERPLTLPRGGPWQYIETDWGALDANDEEFGGDYLVSEWISEQLAKKHEKPFFLACGIYRPHEPWFVPKKYFEPFPLDSVQLPPGYRENDIDDLGPEGQRLARNRYFPHIQEHGQWKQGVQSYLASIHFADAMIGRVLEALDKSPNADNTIVILWSDHGWHLGEKEHWQKYTAWRACTRVPLIVRVPPGTQGLPEGTKPAKCDRPVNLISLFPTLLELSGLPAQAENDGPSLLPLLKSPKAEWSHPSVTYLDKPGSFGLSTDRWRYIHYASGEEELYDIETDPYEWTNLVQSEAHADRLAELRKLAPREFAPKPPVKLEALEELPWIRLAEGESAPPSKPDGNVFPVHFINKTDASVELYWMDREGGKKRYALIPKGEIVQQSTRPGAVWMIAREDGRPLGYFRVDDRTARAIISN